MGLDDDPKSFAMSWHYFLPRPQPTIEKLGGGLPSPLPGKRIGLLDGNRIAKSQHRLEETRAITAGPLPGKSLVAFDPALRLRTRCVPR
jgi:hypothetical protein